METDVGSYWHGYRVRWMFNGYGYRFIEQAVVWRERDARMRALRGRLGTACHIRFD